MYLVLSILCVILIIIWVIELLKVVLNSNAMYEVRRLKRKRNLDNLSFSVFVDPDTEIEYMINDKGGMCPRYKEDGTLFFSKDDDEYEKKKELRSVLEDDNEEK